MRRNCELIRLILEYVEEKGNGKLLPMPVLSDHPPKQVSYHVRLCEEAGYLKVKVLSEQSAYIEYEIGELTWVGHDILEQLRTCN